MIFLRNFEKNPKSAVVLTNIFNMAKGLELDTLCEGVETEEHCEFLENAGCRRLQGYFFGKPMPKETVMSKIEDGTYILSENMDYV